MKNTRHSSHELKYHLVFIPKYRKSILKRKLSTLISDLIPSILADLNCETIEHSVQEDHIHIHFEASPSVALSTIIGKLKSQLSHIVFDTMPEVEEYLKSRVLWARGYYISTTGIDSATVRNYIKNQ